MSPLGTVKIDTGTVTGCRAVGGGRLSQGWNCRPSKCAYALFDSMAAATASAANLMQPSMIPNRPRRRGGNPFLTKLKFAASGRKRPCCGGAVGDPMQSIGDTGQISGTYQANSGFGHGENIETRFEKRRTTMRIELITGAAVLALGMLGSSAALAQNATTGGLSGTAGAMTCGDFTKMDSTAQANVITQANGANSTSSLTSNSGAGSAGTPSGDGTSG